MYKPCSSTWGGCVVNVDLRSTVIDCWDFGHSASRINGSSQPLLDNSKNKCNKVDRSTLLGVDDGSVPDAVDLMVDA